MKQADRPAGHDSVALTSWVPLTQPPRFRAIGSDGLPPRSQVRVVGADLVAQEAA